MESIRTLLETHHNFTGYQVKLIIIRLHLKFPAKGLVTGAAFS